MDDRICIIGSGPTGIFTLQHLVQSSIPLAITIYEAELLAGKGTPYLPGANDPVMLSNIPSLEIPPMNMSLVDWLNQQSDEYLDRFNISRGKINDREFYPRLVLGDYFQAQLTAIVAEAEVRHHRLDICAGHRVSDIALLTDHIRVTVTNADGSFNAIFDHVVMATGHSWPEKTEVKPGYFVSPWPAATLKADGRVGILGTSLSGIDALMTVATSCGSFIHDETGTLQYQPSLAGPNFSAIMMSRKGLLPEADFYCPLPYLSPVVCTKEAIEKEITRGSFKLLDRVFDLFRQEIVATDPDYAAEIGLNSLTVDSFATAYYTRRSDIDPFAWAATNMMEAERNFEERVTVPWRYAILTTHEIIAQAVAHFDARDLARFNQSFKSIFIDEYATVPHLSIKRLLALHNADRLEILKLGDNYEIETEGLSRGARVRLADRVEVFDSFIDATGQSALSAQDLPFPSLVRQGSVDTATTSEPAGPLSTQDNISRRTGGIEVDESYRPRGSGLMSNRLYCVAIPFLLHKHPFVQGITSAAELGETAARAILEDITGAAPPMLLTA